MEWIFLQCQVNVSPLWWVGGRCNITFTVHITLISFWGCCRFSTNGFHDLQHFQEFMQFSNTGKSMLWLQGCNLCSRKSKQTFNAWGFTVEEKWFTCWVIHHPRVKGRVLIRYPLQSLKEKENEPKKNLFVLQDSYLLVVWELRKEWMKNEVKCLSLDRYVKI